MSEYRVMITLSDIGQKKADAVRAALEPDNVGFPEGLSMDSALEGSGLVISFGAERGAAGSLAPTIDDVLGCAQAALGAVR